MAQYTASINPANLAVGYRKFPTNRGCPRFPRFREGEGGFLHAGRVVAIADRAWKNREPTFCDLPIGPPPGHPRIVTQHYMTVIRHDSVGVDRDRETLRQLEGSILDLLTSVFEILARLLVEATQKGTPDAATHAMEKASSFSLTSWLRG